MKRNIPSVCLSCSEPTNFCKCEESQVTRPKIFKSVNNVQSKNNISQSENYRRNEDGLVNETIKNVQENNFQLVWSKREVGRRRSKKVIF